MVKQVVRAYEGIRQLAAQPSRQAQDYLRGSDITACCVWTGLPHESLQCTAWYKLPVGRKID